MSSRRSLTAVALVGCVTLAGCGTDAVTVTASTVSGAVDTATRSDAADQTSSSIKVDASSGSASPSVASVPASSPTPATSAAPKTIALSATSLGVVDMGATKEDTVSAVSAVLGQPTATVERQASFSSFGTCPGTFVEAVAWGDLLLLFGDGDDGFAPGGVRHLFNWSLSTDSPDGPRTGLALGNGLKLGSTVAEVESTYRDRQLVVEDEQLGPSFSVGGNPGIFGTTTGTGDADTVVYLEGGVACGD